MATPSLCVAGRSRAPAYDPLPDAWDEAVHADGTPREPYAALLNALEGADMSRVSRRVASELRTRAVGFGGSGFHVDPIPRLLTASEWELLCRGISQRVRALDAFLSDAYGERRIVQAGHIPAHVLDHAEGFEPAAREIPVPGHRVQCAGLDLVRDDAGRFLVLEDNLRTPSGIAYAIAARDAVLPSMPSLAPRPTPLSGGLVGLGEALRGAAPGVPEPSIVLLSDGPGNTAWWEHCEIARRLGLTIVRLGDLEMSGGRLWLRDDQARRRPVDVVYRRTDEDRLLDDDGRLTAVGDVLLEPLRAGTLVCANAFGNGLADDKLLHGHVDVMVRFYLDEEPALPSVATYDLADPKCRADVLERLGDMVVKPRAGFGGHGIMIGPTSTRREREEAAAEIRRDPIRWVAQDAVMLSTHPTLGQDGLVARHVDLRPFAFLAPDGVHVPRGGLTRVALRPGSRVVNSSQDGGAKDTWVMA